MRGIAITQDSLCLLLHIQVCVSVHADNVCIPLLALPLVDSLSKSIFPKLRRARSKKGNRRFCEPHLSSL